jgi:hypothetical protein
MDDRAKAAFAFLADTCKQLLTLATGILVLTVTFTHDLLGQVSGFAAGSLLTAWLFYLVSVVGGVWLMLAATGSLAKSPSPDIYSSNIRIPALVQVISFALAMIATVVFGAAVTK